MLVNPVQLFAINAPINLCRFLLLLALVECSENSVECLQIGTKLCYIINLCHLTCRSCPVIELLLRGVPEPLLETLPPPPPPSRVSPLKHFWRVLEENSALKNLLEIFGNSCWKYLETSHFHLHLKLINYTRSLRWPFPPNGNHLLPNNTLSSKKNSQSFRSFGSQVRFAKIHFGKMHFRHQSLKAVIVLGKHMKYCGLRTQTQTYLKSESVTDGRTEQPKNHA